MLAEPTGDQKSDDDLLHQSHYKVVIKDIEASGLPKPDLCVKWRPLLILLVCKRLRHGLKYTLQVTRSQLQTGKKVCVDLYTTGVDCADLDPKWSDSFSFEFDSSKLQVDSGESKVLVDVVDHSRGSLGYTILDLPSVLTGPKQNKLTLKKKVWISVCWPSFTYRNENVTLQQQTLSQRPQRPSQWMCLVLPSPPSLSGTSRLTDSSLHSHPTSSSQIFKTTSA